MKRKRKPTITQKIMKECEKNLTDIDNNRTYAAYHRACKYYIRYCRDTFDCKTFDECTSHIQDYIYFL